MKDCAPTIQLAVILARYSDLGFVVHAHNAQLISRHAAKIARYNENACNREVSRRETTIARRCLERIRATLAEDGYRPGIVVEAQGDPRGYAVRFRFPGGESNNWAGDFGIG